MTLPPTKTRLGKGLDGLFGGAAPTASPPTTKREFFRAPIEELYPSTTQPRVFFEELALEELSQSIRELGILEPLLVRQRAQSGERGYEIIAGERRWRAAQRAGLREVPVVVREMTDEIVFEAQLVENLQREDLNPIEIARGFQRLSEEFGYTQEAIAKRVGKDRATVSNATRLLKLPDEVLQHLATGALSEGHGRALLVAGDAATISRLAREALAKHWSVRETERRARGASTKTNDPEKKAKKSVNVLDLEKRLSQKIGSQVRVADRKGKGNVTIAFANYDELDRILNAILR